MDHGVPWAVQVHPSPPFAGARSCDVVVIGSGLMGCSVAVELAGTGLSVVVLDAGARMTNVSCRSAGLLLSTLGEPYVSLVGWKGRRPARSVVDFLHASCMKVARTVRTLGLDCEYEETGSWVLTLDEQEEALEKDSARLLKLDGTSVEWVEREEARHRLGIPWSMGAVARRTDGQLNPALYVEGLRGAATDEGAAFFDHSKVSSIARSKGGFLVKGQGFSLASRWVVVAAGLASGDILPSLQPLLVPTTSQLLMVETHDSLPLGPGFARRGEFYWRRWRDYFIVGGMDSLRAPFVGSSRSDVDSSVQAALEHLLTTTFLLKDYVVKASWAGTMDYSLDAFPFVGPMERESNLFVGCGFTGLGFSYAPAGAEGIARQILKGERTLPDWILPGRPIQKPPTPVP